MVPDPFLTAHSAPQCGPCRRPHYLHSWPRGAVGPLTPRSVSGNSSRVSLDSRRYRSSQDSGVSDAGIDSFMFLTLSYGAVALEGVIDGQLDGVIDVLFDIHVPTVVNSPLPTEVCRPDLPVRPH